MDKLTIKIWNEFIAKPSNKKGKYQLSVRKLNDIIMEDRKQLLISMMQEDEKLGLYDDTKNQEWGFETFIETEEDAKIFIEAMENIPEPNEKLKQAFKNYNAMQNYTITFWQNKQIKQQKVSSPTFDVAYKKFRSEKQFVKILRIED